MQPLLLCFVLVIGATLMCPWYSSMIDFCPMSPDPQRLDVRAIHRVQPMSRTSFTLFISVSHIKRVVHSHLFGIWAVPPVRKCSLFNQVVLVFITHGQASGLFLAELCESGVRSKLHVLNQVPNSVLGLLRTSFLKPKLSSQLQDVSNDIFSRIDRSQVQCRLHCQHAGRLGNSLSLVFQLLWVVHLS